VADAVPPGTLVGRYVIEAAVGSGGMGIVYRAHDPFLSRFVALKLIRPRSFTSSSLASTRLMREAQALAQLSHPNVVAAYDVGLHDGAMFVAMELVAGESLSRWLETPRPREAVLRHLIAAGRGLAAAHAAGVLHRDFKPGNVMVPPDGWARVVDFGLARSTAMPGVELPSAPSSTLLLNADITLDGTVLGTPGYMAPEQLRGEGVDERSDQFGFAATAFRALCGFAPYPKDLDGHRRVLAEGGRRAWASHVPRRIQAVIDRGLAMDRDQRYPSVAALTDALEEAARAPRWPRHAVPAAAFAAVAIAIAVLVLAMKRAPAGDVEPCRAPRRDPATVWSGPESLGAQRELAAAIDRDVAAWRSLRDATCKVPDQRAARLDCFDQVLARIAAIRGGAATEAATKGEELAAMLVDPVVCTRADLPRLQLEPTGDVVAAIALQGTGAGAGELAAFAKTHEGQPCARSVALLALGSIVAGEGPRHDTAEQALAAAEQCGDERLRFDALRADAPFHFETPFIGPHGERAAQRVTAAAARVAQSDVLAATDLLTSTIAIQRGRWTEAFAATDRAIAGFGARDLYRRQLGAVQAAIEARFERSSVEDVEEVRRLVATWKPLAATHDALALRSLEVSDASAVFALGDAVTAHHELARLREPSPTSAVQTQRLAGIVVDELGRPVEGATVAVGVMVFADAVGLPSWLPSAKSLRATTTAAGGRFEIPDAPGRGVVVAEHGELRSAPIPLADGLRIPLAPTRRITGRVELGTVQRTNVMVLARPVDGAGASYRVISPVGVDGSFVLERVPLGAADVSLMIRHGEELRSAAPVRVAAGAHAVTGVALRIEVAAHVLEVIARSGMSVPLDSARIIAFRGPAPPDGMAFLDRMKSDDAQVVFARPAKDYAELSGAARAQLQPGDVAARVVHSSGDGLTVCVMGLNGDTTDALKTLQAHAAEIRFSCRVISPGETLAAFEVPAQRRFD
jgi:hypothetical protein